MEYESRNHKIDNGKAILIFLVVFGHFLELFHGSLKTFLYIAIYSFHMPAFAFFSGYFAKWDPRRLMKQILYPYLCFQILYLLFEKYFLTDSFLHPYTRPYWLMWYLVSLACWYLFLPVLKRYSNLKYYLLAGAVICALLAGYIPWVGYQLSISRTIVLFPFFLMGYLCQSVWKEGIKSLKVKRPLFHTLLLLAIAGSTWFLWIHRSEIRPEWLYHSVSYAKGQYSIWIRGLLLLNAAVWTLCLLIYLPGRRITFLSALGAHTMAVYLLHGFFIKAAKANGLLYDSGVKNLLYAFLLSLLLCFLLGNPVTERLFYFLFSAKWLKR